MDANANVPKLYQFRFSHFNEKARWALDHKGIAHYRHSLLPGPHIPIALWHSHQKQVPFVRFGQTVIAGSAAIIDHLEQIYPQRSLYPRALKARQKALEIQQWLDTEIGPAVRRALFHELFANGDYSARGFTIGASAATTRAYQLAFPLLRPILQADMRIDAKGAELGRAATLKALNFIARTSGPDGYLVGDRFTVADLTAASLLMITTFPHELQFQLPQPHSTELSNWLQRWHGHPGVNWIRQIYRRHRGSSAEIQ